MSDPVRERATEAGTAGRTAEGSVEIDASADAVWRALTDAAELERWFPLRARVEGGEGGKLWLSWGNEFSGEMRIDVWDPPRRLVTTWEMHEGASQVTEYEIESRGGRTFVRVVTSGFPDSADWDDWVEGTRRGWRFELRSLKHYLERHAGEDREVVYLRRRVELERPAIWSKFVAAMNEDADRGVAFDEVPDWQYAAVVTDPPDALARFSVEPGPGGGDAREATVWISAWGDARAGLDRHRERWNARLERAFPDGVTV